MEQLTKITEAKNACGIYAILNKVTSKVYIGSSDNIYKRLNMHRSTLRSDSHHNIHLQRSWNKHGESSFAFCIAERCDPEVLIETEQRWLDETWSESYNLTPTAKSPKGYKHTPEAIAKIKEWQTGRKTPEVVKDRMSQARVHVAGRGKSKYKGLSHKSEKDLWEVRIYPERGQPAIYLGSFKSEKEAAQNYDFYALRFYGKGNCFLNFPRKDYSDFTPKKKL